MLRRRNKAKEIKNICFWDKHRGVRFVSINWICFLALNIFIDHRLTFQQEEKRKETKNICFYNVISSFFYISFRV